MSEPTLLVKPVKVFKSEMIELRVYCDKCGHEHKDKLKLVPPQALTAIGVRLQKEVDEQVCTMCDGIEIGIADPFRGFELIDELNELLKKHALNIFVINDDSGGITFKINQLT